MKWTPRPFAVTSSPPDFGAARANRANTAVGEETPKSTLENWYKWTAAITRGLVRSILRAV